MTRITLEIRESETPGFFLCSNSEHRFGVTAAHSMEAIKLAGELMLYQIKAAQDMTLAEGRQLSETQPRLEHPIEVEWVIKEPVASAS